MKEAVDLYNQMEKEIIQLGWSKILEKYHPDNNLDDPRATELFDIYKAIYQDIKKKAQLAYQKQQTISLQKKVAQQEYVINNYEKIVNRFFYLGIVIASFALLLLAVRLICDYLS